MADVQIEINSDGVKALLQSPELMAECRNVAVQKYGEIEKEFVGFDRCHVIARGEQQ